MRHGAYLRLYITVESKSFNRFIVLRHLFRSATANYGNFLLKICFLNACETYSKLPNILDSRNEKSKNGRKNIFEMVDEWRERNLTENIDRNSFIERQK